jgi:hypothetical protein
MCYKQIACMEEEGRPHQFEAFDKGGGQSPQPEDPRSHTRLAETAKQLGVPSVLLETSEAREYLGVHNELHDLQGTLARAATNLSTVEPEDAYIPPVQHRTPDGSTRFYAQGKKRNLTSGIAQQLRANYGQAAPYLTVAQLMAEEGVDVRTITPEALKHILNPALSHMELSIEDAPSHYDIKPLGWANGDFTSEYYDTRVFPHNSAYEKAHKEDVARREAADDNLKYFLVASDAESKEYIPHGQWLYAPRMHEYTHVLNGVAKARGELREAKAQSLLDSEEYMTKDAARFDRMENMLELAHETLWEGINGHHTPPLKFIKDLNYILDPYHVHIDVKPIAIDAKVEDRESGTDVRRLMEDWHNEQKGE